MTSSAKNIMRLHNFSFMIQKKKRGGGREQHDWQQSAEHETGCWNQFQSVSFRQRRRNIPACQNRGYAIAILFIFFMNRIAIAIVMQPRKQQTGLWLKSHSSMWYDPLLGF